MLFSPGATLAHLMLILVPFAASGLPYQRTLLAVVVCLLLLANGSFILSPARPF